MEQIVIKGKQYPVVFTMLTMINYEDIAGKQFFGESFNSIKQQLALVVAAAKAADNEAKITVEQLADTADQEQMKEVFTAVGVVMRLYAEFFAKPAVEPEDKAEENAKN